MSTLGKALEEANLDKDRLSQELTELTDLLKKLHRMSWGNDTWLYWDDVDSWVVRIQPYRSRTQRVLYEGPSVLEALRVLVGKEAQS